MSGKRHCSPLWPLRPLPDICCFFRLYTVISTECYQTQQQVLAPHATGVSCTGLGRLDCSPARSTTCAGCVLLLFRPTTHTCKPCTIVRTSFGGMLMFSGYIYFSMPLCGHSPLSGKAARAISVDRIAAGRLHGFLLGSSKVFRFGIGVLR